MPGPQPKSSSTRSRRNKSSSASTLRPNPEVARPDLPDIGDLPWHPMTVEWWDDVWASPMAPEYDASDVHGLYLLATLINTFWHQPSKELAGEIRLQRQCYGLSPIDRRRLEWEIERTDEAQDRGRKRRAADGQAKQPPKGKDPRRGLTAVS